MNAGCCGGKGGGMAPQSMADQTPVFDNGHRKRKTVFSRKGGVYRPTKKYKKVRFL